MRENVAQAALERPWSRGSVPSSSDSFSDSQMDELLLIYRRGFIRTIEVYQIGVNALSLTIIQNYIPLRVAAYAPFLSSHSTFLLLESGEPRLTWIVPRLENAGWRLSPIAISNAKLNKEILYRVDRP